MDNTQDLEFLKEKIESLNKKHQIEILKIFLENDIKVNENKSGIFINMSYLETGILEKVGKYLSYIQEQETNLNSLETQKEQFKNTYFNLKGNKGNISLS